MKKLLDEWNLRFFKALNGAPISAIEDYNMSHFLNRSSLGSAPATENQIAIFEIKYDLTLCPDLKDFYLSTNGWELPFFDADPNKILNIGDIIFTKEMDSEFEEWCYSVDDFDDTQYSVEDKFTYMRRRDMSTSLAISPMVDCGCVIANPGYKKKGKWEIFLYTPRAICQRFSSFQEYLEFAFSKNLAGLAGIK